MTKRALKGDQLYQLTKKFLKALNAYRDREAIKEYIGKKEKMNVDLLGIIYPTRRLLILASALHKKLLNECKDRNIPDSIKNFKGVETSICPCQLLHNLDFSGMWKAQFSIIPCRLCGNYGYIEVTKNISCQNPKP